MNDNNVLSCVYCGHQYPEGTPAAKHEILTDHIKICEKHPLREAEIKIKTLRTALFGILGLSDSSELDALELAIRTTPAPDSDKIVSINAIDALRQTS